MREYVGFEYNKAGNLEEKYLYSIEAGELETIEDMINYYDNLGVANMVKERPDFVISDFKKILETLENIIKEEA